jgi:hypothetical protein
MSNPLLAMLAKKKAKLDSKGNDFRPFRPADGKTIIRILPSWRGLDEDGDPNPFWHDFGVHWIKALDDKGAEKVQSVYACPDRTFGEECEVCATIGAAVNYAKDLGDETMEKLVKQANAAENFLMNVQVLSHQDKAQKLVPVVMQCGSVIFKQVLAIMESYLDEEVDIDITDLDKGVDLIIERSGKGRDTEYTVIASPKGSRKTKITGELVDIDKIVATEFAKNKEQRAIAGMSKAIGVEVVGAASSTTKETKAIAPPASSILDEADAEEAEIIEEVAVAEVEEVAEVETAEATEETDELGDDELDDLLADLA